MAGVNPKPTLLVVCTANVCRSPLAQRTLQDGLAGEGVLGDVRVTSAGVRAGDDWEICPVSAAALDPAVDRAFVQGHRSSPLTRGAIDEAALVLTMEREHRSAVARLAPGSQSKVFTLREAEGLLEVLRERGAAPAADLDGLARALHSVRGFAPLPPPPPPKRRWFRAAPEPEDPLTIVDGHGLEDEEHEESIRIVRSTTERVATAMRAALAS